MGPFRGDGTAELFTFIDKSSKFIRSNNKLMRVISHFYQLVVTNKR